ncbi:MAG TPA: ParB N-terminal domain-containing protein [Cyclobacteriaceae bacterium]|nr:ParB N-terminal domain-containing protein [Cyclobacteriaceae bacterium]
MGGALANKQSNDSSIRERIIIRDEFRELIPQLKPDELEQLEENILKEGVRDPLIIWPVGDEFILIDGHNRFSICQKHKLEFPFKKVDFGSEDDARDWMVKNQLGRRNLSPEQQSYLRGLRYNQEKSQGRRSDLTSGQNDQKLDSENTAISLAKEYNVSPKTIIRDAEFAKGVEVIGKKDPELKKKILKGESPISKGKIQILAKKPENIEAVINDESTVKELVKKKLSVEEISDIAFEYILKEHLPPKAFYHSIGKNYDNIDRVEFFQVWDEHRKSKS